MRTQALLLIGPVAAFVLGCHSSTSSDGSRGVADGSGGVGVAGQRGADPAGGSAGVAGGPAGAGGSEPSVEPPADISGRWGMFKFEDPVGVHLFEASDGTLTGTGCAAGAPGGPPGYPGGLFYCGAVTGKVRGETASFSFPLVSGVPSAVYSARVTISHDRQRMAGDFDGMYGPVGPMAWLRVRSDASWLDRIAPTDGDPLSGWYVLELKPDASVGSEFVAGTVYKLGYFDRSLTGDLGGFWQSEVSDPSQGSPLQVGPVPATRSTLPSSLSMDFDATGFVAVTANTPSGGLYRFSAKRM